MEKYRVTHTILRREYYTAEIGARGPAHAAERLAKRLEGVSTAGYEPGDAFDAADPTYEVVAPGGAAYHFNEDLTPHGTPPPDAPPAPADDEGHRPEFEGDDEALLAAVYDVASEFGDGPIVLFKAALRRRGLLGRLLRLNSEARHRKNET